MSAQADGVIRPLGQPGDLGCVVMAHGEVYAKEFGWDTSFEAMVARIVADYADDHDPIREAPWISQVDGRRVGCVSSMPADEQTAKLRTLVVHLRRRPRPHRCTAHLGPRAHPGRRQPLSARLATRWRDDR